MLVEMRRVDIVATRDRARRLVRAVHRMGALHLTTFGADPSSLPAAFRGAGGRPDDSLTTAGEAIAELRRAIATVEASPALTAELWQLDDAALSERIRVLEPVRAEAARLEAERVRVSAERSRTESYRALIDGLQTIVDRLPALQGYGSTAIVVQGRFRDVVPLLRDELEHLTAGRCELIAADLAGDRVGAALLYPQRLAGEVRSLLGGRDIEEISLPAEFHGLPFSEMTRRLVAAAEQARVRAAEIDAALAALGQRHGELVGALDVVLRDRAAEAAALGGAAESEHLVVLSGWLPAGRLDAVRRAVEDEVGPAAAVVERPVGPAELAAAPVAFENRPVLRAFEPLATFVSVPRYGSLDPTPFLAMTLPVFIGLMVGDVGYGLVLLAVLAIARRRSPRSSLLSRALPVGLLAAGSTIVFGLLFGELFGTAGAAAVGLRPLWLDRQEAAISFLALALAIGVAQVTLGLVLGIVNALIVRDRQLAVGRLAMLVGLMALALVLGWLAGPLPASLGYLGAAALVTAIAVLVATLGLAGPIELVGTVTNILSYARLMAIGFASVMLAVVANELGGLVGNVVVGALVALLLHSLNIGLGFFDSSIQGLRLHYVEFFSKFVEPGGARYEPFTAALAATRVPGSVELAGGG
jgi:V/A-type H+-transporting ATPase subunit I